MKVVILAGGFGSRISEESYLKPKPMIQIGEMPILWHIMKIYESYGYDDFIICCGYKSYIIKEFFANYYLYKSDVTFDFSNNNRMIVHNSSSESWKVTLVDTGIDTMTGGRIKRIEKYINNEPFMLTYGDGVSNLDINKLLEYHKAHGKIATITAVNIGQRFGVLDINEDNVINVFREKNHNDDNKINGGFMVLNPEIFQYIDGDKVVFEKDVLEYLDDIGVLMAFKHEGFWQCMDTQKDKQQLEELWKRGSAPWKIW